MATERMRPTRLYCVGTMYSEIPDMHISADTCPRQRYQQLAFFMHNPQEWHASGCQKSGPKQLIKCWQIFINCS